MKFSTSDVLGIFFMCVFVFLAAGWVMNIIALFNAPALAAWAGMEVARVIGIFVAPLGGVLGWF